MRVYFSGIGGVGLGPLAEIAADGGYDVTGSDPSSSAVYMQLEKRGLHLSHDQSGAYLASTHAETPIDWFVHTSALPHDHPELLKARELGIKTSKRDIFLAEFIKDKNLKLLAVAGTHGKTTTTGMLVWLFKQFNVPVSYSIGTTISFGPSGHYDPASEYFVYECDEYDRNFLQFHPDVALIPSFDYDHPDIYPTKQNYATAFFQFFSQSTRLFLWSQDAMRLGGEVLDQTVRDFPDSVLEEVVESTEESVPLDKVPLAGLHN